ncbi:long-chain-fatty-acid--CoA ligase (plasmid) [Sinorhizobium americanum CCGM7]|uniref:class I adenylate-forming enzyme family protein n=1 Tax=Sinorhizobium americanum TaxID=194963 RepID=UPI0004D8285D|nr:class I adenylate-forming enzyme family protein [Sinorhizobium americanum]APG86478.1 long-chain-fatty-acid--CoA ligase [Sinorhizobium americanum CCGM7]
MNYRNYPTIIHALTDWSQRTPDVIAITDGETEISYGQLLSEVEAAARRLMALGVARQDRVIVVGNNSWQWVVCYLATMRIGAISVPMNNRLAPSQVGELVELLGSRVALADDGHVAMFSDCPGIEVFSITGDAARPFFSLRDTPGSADMPEPDEDAVISFTSGTTGIPKGAVITHDALRKAVQVFADLLGTSSSHSTLIVAPLFHNTGFVDQLCTMLVCGGRSDLLQRYRTQAAIDACRRRPVTFVTAVPSVLRMMMTADGADAVYGPAQLVLFGGSPMPAPWSLEIHERWPCLRLVHGYGLTEFTSCCTLLPPELILDHGDSIGYPASGVDLRLVGEDGENVPDGVAGEIWVRGATRMREYWRRPDVTAEKIEGEWLRTGDLAQRRELGLLYHVGRRDDVINRGGEKILPSFIECVMAEVPEVAQAVVFAIPHPVLQNSVIAALEPRPDQTVDVPALLDFLRTRLPGYAVPEAIIVSNDLPRTASGKLDRRAVRAAYLSSQQAQ